MQIFSCSLECDFCRSQASRVFELLDANLRYRRLTQLALPLAAAIAAAAIAAAIAAAALRAFRRRRRHRLLDGCVGDDGRRPKSRALACRRASERVNASLSATCRRVALQPQPSPPRSPPSPPRSPPSPPRSPPLSRPSLGARCLHFLTSLIKLKATLVLLVIKIYACCMRELLSNFAPSSERKTSRELTRMRNREAKRGTILIVCTVSEVRKHDDARS